MQIKLHPLLLTCYQKRSLCVLMCLGWVTFRNIGPLKPHNISEKNIGNDKLQRFFSGGIPYGKNKQQFFFKNMLRFETCKICICFKREIPDDLKVPAYWFTNLLMAVPIRHSLVCLLLLHLTDWSVNMCHD